MKKKCTALFTTIVSWIPRLSFSLALVTVIDAPSLAQVREIREVEIVGQPEIREDEINVRVNLQGRDNKPVVPLSPDDFSLSVRKQLSAQEWSDWEQLEPSEHWRSFQEPDEELDVPVWFVFLLHFTGSMNEEDVRGVTKLTGAINTIRSFDEYATNNFEGDIQMSVVPFAVGASGEAADTCPTREVNNETLDRFLPVGDFKLTNYLNNLEGLTPCGSTDIYTPLKNTIRFFGNPNDQRFSPEETEGSQRNFQQEAGNPQPQLAIVLLSDGYHNEDNEERHSAELRELIEENNQVVIHTIGYGFTQEELGQIYNLGRQAERDDINRGNIPEEEFVDQELLESVSQMTNGISEFSPDSQEIAQRIPMFLEALVGEYQIGYADPSIERGSTHQIRVGVQSPQGEEVVYSEPESYRVTVFGRSPSLPIRLGILLGTLFVIGIGGILPFHFWGKWLKKKEG